jgi:polyisoprenoid-binding protein YceI
MEFPMRLRHLVLSLALAVSATAFAAPVPYTIDPGHTQVHFTYSHLGLSNITGRFDQVEGTFNFDPADPAASSVAVTIPVESIDTGVDKLDAHLKSEDFFDVAKFPTATFTSTKITADGDARWKMAGDLTIHGVTRPVVFDVVVNKVGEHPMMKVPTAGFDASTTVKRSDFGMAYAVPAVGDEVTIRITMEARAPKAQ